MEASWSSHSHSGGSEQGGGDGQRPNRPFFPLSPCLAKLGRMNVAAYPRPRHRLSAPHPSCTL